MNPTSMQTLRTFPASAGLLALIAAVFVIELLVGVLDDARGLVALGANYTPLILEGGQWWRLVTSTILHVNFMHLAMNGWALWQLGRLSELTFGSQWTLALFVFTGITGSALSILSPSVSAGASGALFGLEGALVAFFLRHRDRLTPAGKALLKQLLIWSAFMFVFSFVVPSIDWLGHLGGFLGGIAVGWLLPPKSARPIGVGARLAAGVAAIVLVVSIVEAALFFASLRG